MEEAKIKKIEKEKKNGKRKKKNRKIANRKHKKQTQRTEDREERRKKKKTEDEETEDKKRRRKSGDRSGYQSGSLFRWSLRPLFHLHLGLHFAEVVVEGVEALRHRAVHVGRVVAHEVFLVEERLVGAQEGPDVVVETDVEDLAVGFGVSVVAVGSVRAGEGGLWHRLGEGKDLLPACQREGDGGQHGY